MSIEYPCVFGEISLSPLKSIKNRLNQDKVIYCDRERRFVVLQRGTSDNIHVYKDKNQVLIILGNIYSPIYLTPSVNDKESVLKNVINLEPDCIEGNYLSLYFHRTNDDKLNFELNTDKYGSRMILYHYHRNHLYFSTHLSGLKCLLGNKLPPICRNPLMHYYYFGVTPNNKTLLEGIRKIPPGSSLHFNGSKISLTKYFKLSDLYKPDKYLKASENEICDELNEIMTKSLLKRNQDKRFVSLAISSGVDSGFIAKKLLDNGIKVIGYNLAYGDKYYNEYKRLDRLSQNFGLFINKVKVDQEQIINSISSANFLSSEPIGFNNAVFRILSLGAKKDGFSSLWDGDGADRLFLGMNSHLKYLRTLKIYKNLKKFGLLLPIKKILSLVKTNEIQKLYVVMQDWDRGIPPYIERKYGRINRYYEEHEREIFDLWIRDHWENFDKEFNVKDAGLYFTYQSISMCPEMFFYPPAEQQLYLGLFPVSPYWDDEIVSLALSIPSSLKIKRGKTKYILRKAASLENSPKYWMLPKIGLQSAFDFLNYSSKCREWLNKQKEKILDSQEHKIISEKANEKSINFERLIVLNLWKEANNIS